MLQVCDKHRLLTSLKVIYCKRSIILPRTVKKSPHLCVICSIEMAPVHVVPLMFFVLESADICESVRWFFVLHSEHSEQNRRCNMQEMKCFFERCSIRLTVGNVRLISYLVVHVETNILVTLLGKMHAIVLFYGLCCLGGGLD